MRHLLLLLGLLIQPAAAPIPDLLRGRFVDDYGIVHVITNSSWSLGSRDRYHIVASHDSARYLIAWNDSANAADPGKWTRIDWIPLTGMPPYEWAFCFTLYNANTRAQAEAAPPADSAHPRTGCNGFPYSRMSRAGDEGAPGAPHR